MIITFFILLVLIPLLVWYVSKNVMELSALGVNRSNEQMIMALLSENVTEKTISQMLSICVEFHDERVAREAPYNELSRVLACTDEFKLKELANLPNCSRKVYTLL